MKNTPLFKIHQKLGGTFDNKHQDWNLAVDFTDCVSEHNAVRNDIGIADNSYFGTLRLVGEDRAKFLHRIISNDVENLSVGEGNYATLLTNRGKIIADLRVYILDDAVYINTAPEITEVVYTELDKYIIADDVELTIETDNIGAIGVYGPNSAEFLQSVCNLDGLSEVPDYHSRRCEIEQHSVVCVRSNALGVCGFHLYIEADSLEWLWNKLFSMKPDLTPVGWQALESLRIEAGTPRYGAELTDSVFPLEAELENAIDFEKGCYIGQEIVARMKYRGHPNRLLRGLEIHGEDLVEMNSSIYDDGKEIGWVTSSVISPTFGKPIALGYVRMAYTEPGSKIQIETPKDYVSATIVDLPFIPNTF